jgi:prevent-host-death family protein
MRMVNLHFAKTHLSRLVDLTTAGEEIVIARAGTPVARLIPFEARPTRRLLGLDAGRVAIAADFDAPVPELEAAFDGDDPTLA